MNLDLMLEFDPDLLAEPLEVGDASTWQGRRMFMVYTDRIPAPGEPVVVNTAIAPLNVKVCTVGDLIYSYVAFPHYVPGVNRFNGWFSPAHVQDAKLYGGLCARIVQGPRPQALIYAVVPGSLNDIPSWGDEDACEQLRHMLSELKEEPNVQ